MGCPTNAKQSMLITTVPTAMDLGATLLYRVRAEKLLLQGDQAQGLECRTMDAAGVAPGSVRLTLRAHVVLARSDRLGHPAACSDAPIRTSCLARVPSCIRRPFRWR